MASPSVHRIVPVLRRVITRLRYVPCRELVNRHVVLLGPSAASGAVSSELGLEGIFGSLEPVRAEDSIELTIARYGLIDLEYEVPLSALAPHGRPANADLVQLGFKSDNSGQEIGSECVNGILDEVAENRAYLKLFLRDQQEPSPAAGFVRAERGISSSYWPCRFAVVDACLTNAPSIWLLKHFYW